MHKQCILNNDRIQSLHYLFDTHHFLNLVLLFVGLLEISPMPLHFSYTVTLFFSNAKSTAASAIFVSASSLQMITVCQSSLRYCNNSLINWDLFMSLHNNSSLLRWTVTSSLTMTSALGCCFHIVLASS